MLSWVRSKFGAIILWSFVAVISGSFIFSGVVPGGSGISTGCSSGSEAGSVNGDIITLVDFNRAYQNRVNRFRALGDGKMTDEQLKMFRIKEGVFSELVDQKLLTQEAKKAGRLASEEEVRETIQKIPAFQKDGRFDALTYKQILAANQLNPGNFERNLSNELTAGKWSEFFRARAKVTQDEVRREYLKANEKRDIRYVLVTPEAVKKTVPIEAAEVQKFLADEAKVNLAKQQFEKKKNAEFKGKKFEDVRDSIAREILASDKKDELQQLQDKLATQVEAQLTSKSDLQSILKPYGIEVKQTGLVPHSGGFIPGVGEAKALINDAFAKDSTIDANLGGKAKKYAIPSGWLIALVTQKTVADASKLNEEEESKLLAQLTNQKERDLQDEWMKEVRKKARIRTNARVMEN